MLDAVRLRRSPTSTSSCPIRPICASSRGRCEKLGIPEDKVYTNLQKYGNTSCASIPLCLSEARAEGRLKDGDLVLLMGFGAGLTWGACLMEWGAGAGGPAESTTTGVTDMAGTLILFPGQGSQAAGMAEYLWDYPVARDDVRRGRRTCSAGTSASCAGTAPWRNSPAPTAPS